MQTGSTQLEPNYLISVYADGKHLINIHFNTKKSAGLMFKELKGLIILNKDFKKGDIVLWGKKGSEDFPTRMIESYCLKKEL